VSRRRRRQRRQGRYNPGLGYNLNDIMMLFTTKIFQWPGHKLKNLKKILKKKKKKANFSVLAKIVWKIVSDDETQN
jgi:hypothetical protein